jgi:hypothetical protein
MSRLIHRLLVLALFAFLPLLSMGGAGSADTPVPSVTAVQSYPTLFGQLAGGAAVNVRLTYRSETPLRIRMEGYAAGKRVMESRSNPAPLYPAGTGDALVWLAYETPSVIDELKIIILDEHWQPLDVKIVKARLRWENGRSSSGTKAPDWLGRLNWEQQYLAARQVQQATDEANGLIPFEWVFSAAWLSVVGCIVLQVPMAIRLARCLANGRAPANHRIGAHVSIYIGRPDRRIEPVAADPADAFSHHFYLSCGAADRAPAGP